ncbi:MAG: hypothetical protein WAS05_00890 [Candidatus Nanopelagicales bacterium]
MHKVYLVPGFFGFDELGSMSYFRRVPEVLAEALAERGFDAEIIELNTAPTSSIRKRAVDLMEAVEATGGFGAESISFVGHSTGGLDVRLLLSPGVKLVPDDREEQVGELTRSAISLATPHFGTPMASFFTSMNGRYLLYLLATFVTSHPGRVGTWMGARAITKLARFGDRFGQTDTLVDSFAENMLRHVRPEQSDELFGYLQEMASDQGAMLQLTPEAIDLFNAAVLDRDTVDYVSHVTAAPPPGFPPLPGASAGSIYESTTNVMFGLIYRLASRESRQYPFPSPAEELRAMVQEQLPFALTSSSNDGVVPTLSQVWGRVGGVYLGDHLDVIGQYTHVDETGRYEGWLHSKSGFDEERFNLVWNNIADNIVNPEPEKSTEVAKKVAAKKQATKKRPAKKAVAKKAVAKKTTAKKAVAKKRPTKKAAKN